jgi:tRNA pseudouridine32 synthase / 23S rRNA pseudouridine746 synthase
MKLPLELHLEVKQGCRALTLLQQHSELSTDTIKTCFENGAVWLQTSTANPNREHQPECLLKAGQQIHLYCNQSTLDPCPYRPELIEEFESFSIWNKPSGMFSQGSKWGDHWTLYRWIEQQFWPARKCFITHRLDRYTQGLMIVAHSDECNQRFHRLFEQRQIKKTYHALVKGLIERESAFDINSDVQGKPALTQVRVLARNEQAQLTLIEAQPETGRKHQIRIHLASIGHPIVNDRQYGVAPHLGDLQLQASGLQFAHPYTRQELQIKLQQKALLSTQPETVIK